MSQQYIGTGRIDGVTQTAAFTAASGPVTNAFGPGITKVRVVANSACHVRVAVTPTATTADPFLPANAVEYFTVKTGEKIAAIRAGTSGLVTATDGTLWVTEL